MLLKIFHFKKTLTVAGVREQLTTAKKTVPSVVIQAPTANSGEIYIGNNTVSSIDYAAELPPGSSYELTVTDFGDANANWDLSDFFIDGTNSLDAVFCSYAERMDE